MATTQPTKTVMSRKEAAEYIGVCKTTLDRLPIPRTQVRRRVLYQKEAIDKWLAAQQTKQQTKGKGTPA